QKKFRMLLAQPCRENIRRRAKDCPYSVAAQDFQDPLQPAEIIMALRRFESFPVCIRQTHRSELGFLHEPGVEFYSFRGPVFRVVVGTIFNPRSNGWCDISRLFLGGGRFHESREGGTGRSCCQGGKKAPAVHNAFRHGWYSSYIVKAVRYFSLQLRYCITQGIDVCV